LHRYRLSTWVVNGLYALALHVGVKVFNRIVAPFVQRGAGLVIANYRSISVRWLSYACRVMDARLIRVVRRRTERAYTSFHAIGATWRQTRPVRWRTSRRNCGRAVGVVGRRGWLEIPPQPLMLVHAYLLLVLLGVNLFVFLQVLRPFEGFVACLTNVRFKRHVHT
jgi:hypothetical protein